MDEFATSPPLGKTDAATGILTNIAAPGTVGDRILSLGAAALLGCAGTLSGNPGTFAAALVTAGTLGNGVQTERGQ